MLVVSIFFCVLSQFPLCFQILNSSGCFFSLGIFSLENLLFSERKKEKQNKPKVILKYNKAFYSFLQPTKSDDNAASRKYSWRNPGEFNVWPYAKGWILTTKYIAVQDKYILQFIKELKPITYSFRTFMIMVLNRFLFFIILRITYILMNIMEWLSVEAS